MSARAIGSGTIAFGMVVIPVKIYPSTKGANAIKFNQLHEACGGRLKQKNHCPACDADVSRDEMVKGYEFAKGQYVTFDAEELKALEAQSTGEIQISEFVPLKKVDPIYFDKGYYLGYDKGAQKAYSLLCVALRKAKLAAVARYTARGKEYLVLLRPTKKGIILQQMHHDEDVRDFSETETEICDVDEGQLALAQQIIAQSSSDRFKPAKYKDELRAKVQSIIDDKIEGKEILAPVASAPHSVIDLMSALKASLAGEETPVDEAAEPSKKKKSSKSKTG